MGASVTSTHDRQCLSCGMEVDDDASTCPKCDAVLGKQTDGSVKTIDIAHHEETVAEATEKLGRAIDRHLKNRTATLRVIVGQGRIREGIQSFLETLRVRRKIRDFRFEKQNHGAILIRLG